MKLFFKKLFYFSEIFPKRFFKEYEKEMKSFDWRMKRGIKSLGKDPSWEDKGDKKKGIVGVDELEEKFYEKTEVYFTNVILENMFG